MLIENKKIAVLIDGDNADANLIEKILNEVAKFGKVTIKRVYADFTNQKMNSWKEQLNTNAVRPIQKFEYTKGKNSTDTALIIDAMDILHSKLVDGFCIVSSDSDYTGIAHRIREEGYFVIGIGKSHTPVAFVKACENFIYTEILTDKKIEDEGIKEISRKEKDITKKSSPEKKKREISLKNIITKEPLNIETVNKAFEMVYDTMSGLALASQFSSAFKKVDPTFDIRNYGHTSFRKFLEALSPNFEIVLHDDKKTLSVKRVN
jgi:uncharacterized protein (TIGR00288 family)